MDHHLYLTEKHNIRTQAEVLSGLDVPAAKLTPG